MYRSLLICLLSVLPLTTGANSLLAENIRIATFNTSLNRARQGQLQEDLARGDTQAQQVAAILQHVRPDIVLLNEFDWDEQGHAVKLFVDTYLGVGQFEQSAIEYTYRYSTSVNTGISCGHDLNGNLRTSDPEDAFGFGKFPGQYGMVVLSRFPIDEANVRTFQKLLWKDKPDARLPVDPDTKEPFYTKEARDVLRLSSKSHWDVPIEVAGRKLHFLVCHPTPPVFDGREDRNGLRNNDEILFWADYITTDTISADAERDSYIVDDQQRPGGLDAGSSFVIAGDLNSDANDGDSQHDGIRRLLQHPRVQAEPIPASLGGEHAASKQLGANQRHAGNPAHDTADFFDGRRGSGNLRVDYVLPSTDLRVISSGVFWPTKKEIGQPWLSCSDHRLVWVDLQL